MQTEAQKVISKAVPAAPWRGALVTVEPGTRPGACPGGRKDYIKSQFNRAHSALRSTRLTLQSCRLSPPPVKEGCGQQTS